MKGASRTATAQGRGYKRVIVQLPIWLWDEIDRLAQQNWRTRTAEVQSRLEQTLTKNEHGVIVAALPAQSK